MVTGDNVTTARAIAGECGILTPTGRIVEGKDFRQLSERDLLKLIPSLDVSWLHRGALAFLTFLLQRSRRILLTACSFLLRKSATVHLLLTCSYPGRLDSLVASSALLIATL